MNKLWEILVPTIMDGKPVRTRYHKVWDSKTRAIAKGLTILTPTKSGQWVSPAGELFIERSIPVRIMCTEEQINVIANMTARYYRQQAILLCSNTITASSSQYETF